MKIEREDLERAARAMCDNCLYQWGRLTERDKNKFRRDARAAAIAFGLEVEE